MRYLPSLIAFAALIAIDVVFLRWVFGDADGDPVTQGFTGLVLGVITLTFIVALYRFVASAAKGRIEVDVPQRIYSPGETIAGTVTVNARRSLDAERLTLSILATATRRDDDRAKHTIEVFRHQQDLVGAMQFSAGATSFPFTVELPDHVEVPNGVDLTELLPEGLGGLISTIPRLPASAPEFFVEAELLVSGVDLSAREVLRTNVNAGVLGG